MQTRHHFYGSSSKRGALVYVAALIDAMNKQDAPEPRKPQNKRQARRNRHRHREGDVARV